MLDVEPAILYPMIDRLLGGRGDEPPPGRPLSDIELPLAARIVRLFLGHLQAAWKSVLDLKFDILQVESNPRLLRVLPWDEMVVVVGFQFDPRRTERDDAPLPAVPSDATHRRDPVRPRSVVDGETWSRWRLRWQPPHRGPWSLESLRVGDIIATETAVAARWSCRLRASRSSVANRASARAGRPSA